MSNSSQDAGTEGLQRYYTSRPGDYEELRKKAFAAWYPKYYAKLKPVNRGPVLDVGCGAGQVVNRFAAEGYAAVGVDISPGNLQRAGGDGGGAFVVASAHRLPFRDNAFETVGGYDFLEHTHYPHACLGEMVRVLKPQGRIVITSPNFLKVVGLRRDYHWHMQGLRRKASNLHRLLRKIVGAGIRPPRAAFEFMEARSDCTGGDVDAVCVTNPVDVKAGLEGLGVKVTYQSASSTVHPNRVVETLSEIPVLRSMTGGFIMAGTKQRQEPVERHELIGGGPAS